MAQRKRAGLITPRSPDQNGSPVYIITSQWCIKALEQYPTDMAQRQRAGLITPRTQDRNLLSVSFFISPKLISPYPTHFPVSHSFPVTAAPPHFFSSTIYSGLFNACLPACLRMPITLCALPPCSPRFHRPIFPPRPLYMRKTPSTSARCAEMTRWCSG